MTATKSFTPVETDYPDLTDLPSGLTFLGTTTDGKIYEFTIPQLQSITGWNGTGSEGGGTGDAEYETLASTGDGDGAELIGFRNLSAYFGGAATVQASLEWAAQNFLPQSSVQAITETTAMTSNFAYVIWDSEEGGFTYVLKDNVDTSQGQAQIVTAATYDIGQYDIRVTGDSSSNQEFTIKAAADVPRELGLPLRAWKAGTGNVKVQMAAGVSVNGAVGGSVTLTDRYSTLLLEQIATDRWVSSETSSQAATDVVAPTLSSTSPSDNATGVAIGATLTATFNEAVAFGTGVITLRTNDGGWSSVETFDVETDIGSGAGQVRIVSSNTLEIRPTSALTNAREYAIQIASTAIDDLAGNSYAGIANDTTWSFTTIASSPSSVTIISDATQKFSVAASTSGGNHEQALSGLLENDKVFVAIAADAPLMARVPSGYSVVHNDSTETGPSFWVGSKVMGATPDTSILIPRQPSRRAAVIVWALRGANANLDGEATGSAAVSGLPNPPEYIQTNANVMPFAVGAMDDKQEALTAPAGLTLLATQTAESSVEADGCTLAVAYGSVSATAGTSHNPGAFGGLKSDENRGCTFGQH